MNDNFKALNRRKRRWYDKFFRLQFMIGTLAGLCILATICAQCYMKWWHQ